MNLYKYVSDAINTKLGQKVNLEVPRNREFGDFSTNAAMVMAKATGRPPRELATDIATQIAQLDFVSDTSIAGPGFINIKIKDDFLWNAITVATEIEKDTPPRRLTWTMAHIMLPNLCILVTCVHLLSAIHSTALQNF